MEDNSLLAEAGSVGDSVPALADIRLTGKGDGFWLMVEGKNSPRFFENYLLAQLAIVSHRFSSDFNDVLRDHGMSRSKWRVLSNLYDVQGMYVGELVVTALLEQSHITKLTDQLAEEGLVKKSIDEADRRKVIVSITAAGKQAVAPLIQAAKDHEAKVLASLDPDDANRLREIMRKLVTPHIEKLQRRRID